MVFSVGIIVLVLSGVVVLLINSVGARSKSLARNKAARMAEMVIEDLGNKKRNEAESFWGLSAISGETISDFDGYVYSVGYSVVNNIADCINPGVTMCADATISVGWSGAVNQEYTVRRFFSRN